MRKRMIAGNWKMNETFTEGVVLAQGLAKELAGGTGDVDVVVCPPAVDLKGVSEVIEQEGASLALPLRYISESTRPMLTSYCVCCWKKRRP